MNFTDKAAQLGKRTLAVSLVLLLAACQQDFDLLNASHELVGNGTLEVTTIYPSPIRATLNGVEFKGHWKSTKVYESWLAKEHRLTSAKSYQAYMMGNTPDRLRHGEAMLTSEDGSSMVCNFYYCAQRKSGSCIINGDAVEMIFSTA